MKPLECALSRYRPTPASGRSSSGPAGPRRGPRPARGRTSVRCTALGLAAVLGILALSACASQVPGTVYYHPNADFSTYGRIAVLPLENLAVDRAAGERVRDVLVAELAAQGVFEVVDVGEVNRVLREQGFLDSSAIGPEGIRGLGEELGTQALVLGTVIEYRERRSGAVAAPEVALSVRLLDVESGIVVWSVSDARTGARLSTRLFGLGEMSLNQATREIVRRMIDTIVY